MSMTEAMIFGEMYKYVYILSLIIKYVFPFLYIFGIIKIITKLEELKQVNLRQYYKIEEIKDKQIIETKTTIKQQEQQNI